MSATTNFGTFGNRRCIWGVATVTGTEAIVAPFNTISFALVSITADYSGATLLGCTVATSGCTATIKVWKPTASGNVTAAAADAAFGVNYLLVGPS